MQKGKKPVNLIHVFCFIVLLSLLGPVQQALAWSDPGLSGVSKDATVKVGGFTPDKLQYSGVWRVTVNGSQKGATVLLYQKSDAGGRAFVLMGAFNEAVSAFGGVSSHVNSYSPYYTLFPGGSQRYYIRDLAYHSGAYIGYSSGVCMVTPSPLPQGSISAPATAKVNQAVNITLSGMSLTNTGIVTTYDKNKLNYDFKINGSSQSSGSGSKSISKTISHTFTSPGTYTLTLNLTDAFERKANPITKTIVVSAAGGGAAPIQPSGGRPLADFDMQDMTATNTSVPVTDRSQAYGGATITTRTWTITPSGYTGSPSGSSYSLKFPSEGTYTVKLVVKDSKGNTSDPCEKTILVQDSGITPEPPPPPEPPPNKPPIAKMQYPRTVGIGKTAQLTNLSYDPDGSITDVDWDIDPQDGQKSSSIDDSALEDEGGTVTFKEEGEYEVTLEVTDDQGETDSVTGTIDVKNSPPRAVISCPTDVMQGDDVVIKNLSYDPDGEVKDKKWTIELPDGGVIKNSSDSSVVAGFTEDENKVYFDKEGTYKVSILVTDDWGKTDSTTKDIVVKPAIPNAYYEQFGPNKQNRKMDFTAGGTSPSRYPIVTSLNEWSIEPITAGLTADDIKIRYGSPDDKGKRTLMFKKAGQYKVKLKVTNTAGHTSEWYEQTYDIQADAPPIADFNVQSAYIRNPDEADVCDVLIRDLSYSPDGDTIAKRAWRYKFDSDNDGSFDDEAFVLLDDDNNPTPSIKTTHVGKYMVELEVTEGFGEEALDEFLTADDYQKSNTDSKSLTEKRTEVINVQPTVAFDVKPVKKVDIVFTVGDTPASKTSNLKGLITTYLETQLNSYNIQYGTVKSVDTATTSSDAEDASAIFSKWTNYPDSSGQWHYDSSKKALGTTQNVSWTGYWDKSAVDQNDYTFTFKTGVFPDNDGDNIGWTFRMSGANGQENFYAFIFNGGGMPGHDSGAINSGLWKISNGNYSSGELLQSIPVNWLGNRWYNVKIEAKGNNFKISIDGTKYVDYTDNSSPYLTGGYGPFSYSQRYAYYTDINIESKTIVTLDDILKNPLWRDDAMHFLVNISDKQLDEFNDPIKSAYIYSKLLKNQVDFSLLGTTTNQTQANSVIALNDGNGKFVRNDNPNMDTAVQQISQYIVDKVNAAMGNPTNYVLLGQDVEYKTYYNDYEKDPEFAQRWIYDHNADYFENSLGKVPFDDQWIGNPIYRFDKVGKFLVDFQKQDNPSTDDRFAEYRQWSYSPSDKLELYVHRRPIGNFSASMNKSGSIWNVSYNSNCYDLDHLSQPDKGIVQEKWSWRLVSSPTWNVGRPSTLADNQDYMIKYEVQDREGAWSLPDLKLLSTRNINLPPVACFTVTPNPVVANKSLSYKDLSYSPVGKTLTIKKWRYQNPSGTWSSVSSSPTTSFSQIGDYKIELIVGDGTTLSEPYYQTVTVIADNRPPTVSFDMNPSTGFYDYAHVDYTIHYSDPDGDPCGGYQWAIKKDGSAWFNIVNPPETFDAFGPGSYKIALRAIDIPRLAQLAAKWSSSSADPNTWFIRSFSVLEGFAMKGSVTPTPAERGRKMRVYARAVRPSDMSTPVDVDSVTATIIDTSTGKAPDGFTPTVISLSYDSVKGLWWGEYLIPSHIPVKGKWPDNGNYEVIIDGKKGITTKTINAPFTVKGNILDRLITVTQKMQ